MKFINKFIRIFKKYKTQEEIHNFKIQSIARELSGVESDLIELLPEELVEDFKKHAFISGGCIYSLYHGNEPKDYDFFLSSKELAEEMREYFIDVSGYHGRKMSGGQYKELPLIVTDNAISIGKYQIITRWNGSPEEIVSEFDFHHNSYYFKGGKVGSLGGFDSLKSNELKYNEDRARDIVGTLMRIPKFLSRGMTMKQREMSKMLLRLHEVGFNERELELLNDINSDQHFSS